MNVRYSSEKREELKKLVSDLYKELGSGDAVIKKLGMARTTVYRLLHESGISLPDRHDPQIYQRRKGLQGEEAINAVKDYVEGLSVSTILKKYNIGPASLYTAIKDAGVERRPRGQQPRRFSVLDKLEIVRLCTEAGMSQEHIAVKFNSSQGTISRILRAQGIKTDSASGNRHGNWIGGRISVGDGYVKILISEDDPMTSMKDYSGYVPEHRLVMARHLGRPLTSNESVHHLDGDRSNNSIENLQLRQGRHGKGSAYVCADCGSHNVVPAELKEEAVPYEV